MSTTKKWILGIVGGLIFLAVGIPTLIAGGRFAANSVIVPVWNWGLGVKATTQNSAASNTPAPTAPAASAAPAATSVPASNDMALNESTSVEPLKNPLWDDYHKTGVQISNDQNNTVWYVQSSKEGTMTLKGSVPKGQILVVDAYTMVKSGTEYTGGCLLLLRGPIDLDTYEITITNGAAQLVDANHVQELLDYNIAVKFARGDWSDKKGEFTYQPWALAHVWVLDYTYNSLVGKLTVENDDYPR